MVKKIIGILLILAGFGLIMFGAFMGYINYISTHPKLEKIELLSDKKIKLYVNDTYDVDYNIHPVDAKKVDIIIDNSNSAVTSIQKKTITALATGNSKICFKQKDDEKIKECIDVVVTTKRAEIIDKLDNRSTLTKVSEGVYKNSLSQLDVLNGVFTYGRSSDGVTIKYDYHFFQGYVIGFNQVDDSRADIYYDVATGSMNCVGNSLIVHNSFCSYSSQESAKSTIRGGIQLFESYISPYTIDDLKY